MAKRIELTVGSTYPGKLDAAKRAAEEVFGRWYGGKEEIIVNVRGVKVPPEEINVPEQPFGRQTYDGAQRRVDYVRNHEFKLADGRHFKSDNPDADFEFIVGMESGLFRRGLHFYDRTVATIESRKILMTTIGISDGVLFPWRYILETFTKPGRFKKNTVGSVISARLGGDKQDPYGVLTHQRKRRQQYLEQAAKQAFALHLRDNYDIPPGVPRVF